MTEPPLPLELETPALLIERAILDENVAAMQRIADSKGVALRPHAKTHKLPELAQLQVDRGARGVTVATLTEAECMVAAGIDNLFLAYPPTGKWRLERLAPILGRASVTVGLDTLDAVRSLSRLGAELRRTIAYRWEVDSGLGRLGTAPGRPTLDRLLPALDEPWTEFAGLFTHAGHSYKATSLEEIEAIGRQEGECLVRTAGVLRARGIRVNDISVGSTPTARFAAAVPGVTEVRPGTYVYNDSTQLALGVVEQGACAQSVLATCIGRPTADRTVVDAGSKALPMEDPSGRARGWGTVIGHPGLIVERLFEEHAVIFGHTHIRVGDSVRIIPNHACTATNLHSHAIFVDGASVEGVVSITARNWRSPGSGAPMPTRG